MTKFIIFFILLGSSVQASSVTCGINALAPKSTARIAFEEITEERDFQKSFALNRKTSDETFDAIQHRGLLVSVLVKDARFDGGERLITGYLYEVIETRIQSMSVDAYLKTLNPAERAVATRGKRWGNESRVAPLQQTLVLTTRAPTLESSNDRVRSLGWYRQPPKNTLVRIVLGSERVVDAKYITR